MIKHLKEEFTLILCNPFQEMGEGERLPNSFDEDSVTMSPKPDKGATIKEKTIKHSTL